jgi:ATP-dependent Lon protease
MEAGKNILLVAQKSAAKDEPVPEDMYEIGCLANILQMLKLPDGTVKVLVEGVQRARVLRIEDQRALFVADVALIPVEERSDNEIEAMRRTVLAQFDQYVKLNKKIPPEVLTSLAGIEEAGRLADTIAAHLPLKLEQKQEVLEVFGVAERLEKLLGQLEAELDILQVEKRIRGRVKRQMEKSQREYYLNEQVKAIQKELGEGEDGADIDEMEKKIKAAGMSKEALAKANGEVKKLKLMSPMSAEATVVRNYIETLLACRGRRSRASARTWRRREDPRQGSLRPGEGQGAHRRVPRRAAARGQGQGADPVPGRPSRVSARPRSASRSPAPPTASSSAWRWAACATRPRSAATAAPTSARCPARSCRT